MEMVVDHGSKKCEKLETKHSSAWISFDFQSREVCLTGCSIRSGSAEFPVSWSVVGSNDAEGWDIADE